MFYKRTWHFKVWWSLLYCAKPNHNYVVAVHYYRDICPGEQRPRCVSEYSSVWRYECKNECNCNFTAILPYGMEFIFLWQVIIHVQVKKLSILLILILKSIYFVNCSWADTRWQQYSTHLHTQYTEQHNEIFFLGGEIIGFPETSVTTNLRRVKHTG